MLGRKKVLGGLLLGLLVGVAGVFLLGGGAGHGRTPEKAAKEAQPVPVTVAALRRQAVRRTVEVVGTFQGYEEVAIATKVDGRVLHIKHEVGDEVVPGELLLQLEDADYKLAVAEAQRGLEMELTKLGLDRLKETELVRVFEDRRTDKDITFEDLPAVVRARTQEELAQQIQDRSRRLRLGGAVGNEDLEKARTEVRMAAAAKEQALLEARATLASARYRHALLRTAQQKLAETRLVVPGVSANRLPPGLTGAPKFVVSQRLVAEGEVVSTVPPTTVFKLVLDSTLKLMGLVPERYLSQVAVGQRVGIAVEAYPGQTFQGSVARINPTVDRASRSFTVEVAVPNAEHKLKAGGFAKASILTRPEDQASTVPEEAVVRFAGVTKVFVVKDGKALAIPVTTGERLELTSGGKAERWIEVTGPIPPGTPVVTTGHSQLADGTPVRVR